jgi:hypothetical protein
LFKIIACLVYIYNRKVAIIFEKLKYITNNKSFS